MNEVYARLHVPKRLRQGDIGEVFVVAHQELSDFAKEYSIDTEFKPIPGKIPIMRNLLVQQDVLVRVAMDYQANLALVDGDNVSYMRCQEYKGAGREFPGLGVASIIIDNQGKYLLNQRGPIASYRIGQWELAGGTIEHNETLFDAAKREAEEETPYIVTPESVVSVYEEFVEGKHWNCFGVLCKWDGEVNENFVLEEGKIADSGWFNYEDFPSPMNPGALTIINDYKKGIIIPVRRLTE